MEKPLVSVIMPVYNGEKYIGKAIRPLRLLPKRRRPFSRIMRVLMGAKSSETPIMDMVPSGLI